MEKYQHNGQSAQPIPADMLVMMIGEERVENRVLRAQLAQTQAALVAAHARIGEMGKAADELAATVKELSEVNKRLTDMVGPGHGGLGGQSGPGGLGGPAEPESEAVEDAVDAEPEFLDCAGVNYDGCGPK